MKKLLCKIFDHKYENNHTSQPTRLWCNRCGKEWKLAFNKPPCHPFELTYWEEIGAKTKG